MDFAECKKQHVIKEISVDFNRILSIRNVAQQKILSADYLPKEHIIARISLLYDALRELLEALALEKGYKIYNHECYTAFLKEILHKSNDGDLFDALRKIRNRINYYGKEVSVKEGESVVLNIKRLIKKFFEGK